MTTSPLRLHIGQAVHRPAAFLLGERLNGTVHELRASALTRSCSGALVAWPDGTFTEEPVDDLAAGATPAPAVSWYRRVWAQFTR